MKAEKSSVGSNRVASLVFKASPRNLDAEIFDTFADAGR
jgi:hypothetical protein